MAFNPGDSLANGQYRIERLLGRGGFGFVYLAQDTVLQEPVAIKELIPALVGDESLLKRFLSEARLTIHLTHKRIVRTHNVFPEHGNYYIAMEYMPGGSLEERLGAGRPLPVDEAVRIAADVCEALACAHEDGIVHCDLKPANILFGADGRAKVADFGIAYVPAEMFTRSWVTPAGFVAGTLPYMAPEQAEGVRDEPRMDVYALGAVLYRMLTGRMYLDFDPRETPLAQARNAQRILTEAPAPPSVNNRAVPAWLDRVVLRALAKKADQRWPTAGAMREALGRQTPAAAAAQPGGKAQQQNAKPMWLWASAAGIAVLLLVLVVAAVVIGGSRDSAYQARPGPATRDAVTAAPAAVDVVVPTDTPVPPTSRPAGRLTDAGTGAAVAARATDMAESAHDLPEPATLTPTPVSSEAGAPAGGGGDTCAFWPGTHDNADNVERWHSCSVEWAIGARHPRNGGGEPDSIAQCHHFGRRCDATNLWHSDAHEYSAPGSGVDPGSQ